MRTANVEKINFARLKRARACVFLIKVPKQKMYPNFLSNMYIERCEDLENDKIMFNLLYLNDFTSYIC